MRETQRHKTRIGEASKKIEKEGQEAEEAEKEEEEEETNG